VKKAYSEAYSASLVPPNFVHISGILRAVAWIDAKLVHDIINAATEGDYLKFTVLRKVKESR